MAVSAGALEIFNTLYPQFGWVILTKFFLLFFFWVGEGGGGSMFYFMRLIGFFIFFLLYSVPLIYPAFCFCFSLCHRWTDQSRWSRQTVRAGEVLYALPRFFSSPHPAHLPCFLAPFVPTLPTFCLCISASPLCVLSDNGVYVDAGWQRGPDRTPSTQNTLC